MRKRYSRGSNILTCLFIVVGLLWIVPIIAVTVNSFKSNAAVNQNAFALPNAETFVGFDNFVKGMTFGNYPFWKSVGYSLFITLASTALILICTSMAAWYISRVGSTFQRWYTIFASSPWWCPSRWSCSPCPPPRTR